MQRPLLPEHELVIDERVALVHDATALPKATPRVEPARSRLGIVRIQANGVRWPCSSHGASVLEGQPTKALSLMCYRDCPAPRSVTRDDQWPSPQRFVRAPAAAFWSPAITATSSRVASRNFSCTRVYPWRADSARQIHPARNAIPPSGVIAPSQRTPESARA